MGPDGSASRRCEAGSPRSSHTHAHSRTHASPFSPFHLPCFVRSRREDSLAARERELARRDAALTDAERRVAKLTSRLEEDLARANGPDGWRVPSSWDAGASPAPAPRRSAHPSEVPFEVPSQAAAPRGPSLAVSATSDADRSPRHDPLAAIDADIGRGEARLARLGAVLELAGGDKGAVTLSALGAELAALRDRRAALPRPGVTRDRAVGDLRDRLTAWESKLAAALGGVVASHRRRLAEPVRQGPRHATPDVGVRAELA